MDDYTFRIRFRLCGGRRISRDAELLELSDSPNELSIVLKSADADKRLSEAEDVVLLSKPYPSEASAQDAAIRWRGYLCMALASLHIGADFGMWAPKSYLFEGGLKMLADRFQVEHPVLNDRYGIMVFPSEPVPILASAGVVTVTQNYPDDRVLDAISRSRDADSPLSEIQHLAFDLYSVSFIESTPDARFVMLMMALETLISPASRSSEAQEHINELTKLTKSVQLETGERDSLLGGLNSLRNESIGQAGRALARTLAGRIYGGEDSVEFFNNCYRLRSDLVHGSFPRPEQREIIARTGPLQWFVGDLLAISILSPG